MIWILFKRKKLDISNLNNYLKCFPFNVSLEEEAPEFYISRLNNKTYNASKIFISE